jgi:transcriptional regulator with XRE-family HTH domain
MQTFVTNVRNCLSERGWTIADLASRMGIERPNLSRILNGREGVTIERAERVAAALEVELSKLLTVKSDAMSTFGENLKIAMNEGNWKVASLAAECGLSEAELKDILDGKNNTPILTMEILANALWVPLRDLLTLSREAPVEPAQVG